MRKENAKQGLSQLVSPFAPDKIFAHKDRVAEWLETGGSRPITAELDMTNACNQDCPHCFGYYPERDKAQMSLEEAKGIIRELKEGGLRGLTFTGGGDPLVNSATPEAVRYAVSIGLDVGFITSAQMLKEPVADVLLQNCVWLRVSIDAATPEMFRKTHGMGPRQFDQVLDHVRLLVGRKKTLGSRTTLGIGFLTSPQTKSGYLRLRGHGKVPGRRLRPVPAVIASAR